MTMMRLAPRFANSATRCEPMKPQPPVTAMVWFWIFDNAARVSHGFGRHLVQPVDASERWKPPGPERNHQHGADSAGDHGWDHAQPGRRQARLELTELVGGADEHQV